MVWAEGLPSGRERAIEILIDREPQGAFYRAARVLDEVVPQALVNRPNVITKGALVEQANAFSCHEIGLSNYDTWFGVESSSSSLLSSSSSNSGGAVTSSSTHAPSGAQPSSLTSNSTERILRHHAKQCSVLQQQRMKANKHQHSSGASTTPSPQLVAALRQVYGTAADDTPSFNFRTLLKSIMDHKIFETAATHAAASAAASSAVATEPFSAETKQQQQSDEETSKGTAAATTASAAKSGSKEGSNAAAVAQLESLIANVCRMVDQKDQTPNTVIQGLLVAALSVLTQTGSSTSPESESDGGDHAKKNKGNQVNNKSASAKPNKKSTTEDPAASPALLVGSVLSLLKIEASNNKNSSPLEKLHLDPELIEYFASAAWAYEARIEMQKARLLAKIQQDIVEASRSEPDEPGTVEPVSDVTASETNVATTTLDTTQNDLAAASTSATSTSTEANTSNNNNTTEAEPSTAFTDHVAIVEGNAAAGQQDRLGEATLATVAALEQIISSATGDETSSAGDEEDEVENTSGSGSRSGSGSDSDEEIDAGPASGPGDTHSNNDDEHEAGTGSPATDDEGDAQGEDEDSSSSSSADDWGMMEGRAGGAETDEVVGDAEDDNDDDEEEDVLQQALALSLSDNNGSVEASGRDEQAAGIQANDANLRGASSTIENWQPKPAPKPPMSNSDDADSSLLPLPPKPSCYPYAASLGHGTEIDSEQNSPAEHQPYFDPSVLDKFGALPTANVLVHLIQYTAGVIETLRFSGTSPKESSGSTEGNFTSLPGGIGGSLFPSRLLSSGKGTSSADSTNAESASTAVTIQLLVAFFLHTMEKRDDAVAGLRKALAHAERHVQGEDVGGETGTDANGTGGDNTPLSSEDEDDPAIALAMNYAVDDVESSESLEAKGMIRKAAAAAHDAAALLRLLRHRCESWKQNVNLYSVAAALALKSLRIFLQSTVRHRLYERESGTTSPSCVADCSEFLPSLVSSKLSMALASLMSVSSYSACAALLGGDDGEVGDVFLPLILYKEAVSTWGECVPIVYPSVTAQIEILRSLIAECCTRPGSEILPHFRSVESLIAMPSSEIEPQVHRLQCLCKRLRVADLLDNLIPHPACYIPDAKHSEVDGDTGTPEDSKNKRQSSDPFRSSALVSLVASATKEVRGGKGELQRLFLALCHRYHSRVLLWGGLYESSESDVDDVAGTVGTPTTASSGDVVRIGAVPSNTLQFDATKCSDSIAILANLGETLSGTNGSSVHQRASKVWGTVLSTHHYNPKTGTHRWAVRLDKCERGHVFVGVATTQASMRTYVGGDKYGWGMIGTQALWHDRRKIRGDYGATFRTGSTIIVTLDTDAGTLSFSSWKDNNSSSSFSLDPLLQNQSASRRHVNVGGTVEDWGIAFEGLPLDSRLYPAVGLYQRDDRVTLLTVESSSNNNGRDGSLEISGGLCYYPLSDAGLGSRREAMISHVRRFNDILSWEGVQYVLEMFQYILQCLENDKDTAVVAALLPSFTSALCLVPNSIPILSERFALTLLPHLRSFLLKLDAYRIERGMVQPLFGVGLKPGKWVIRATGSSGENSDFEEYVVDFTSTVNEQGIPAGFEGTGVGTTGKSKNGLVTIFGTTQGSSVHFVEEWSDGSDEGFGSSATPDDTSSCVVAARMSLDGTKFEGSYRNVQFGTSGKIAGMLQSDQMALSKMRTKEAPSSSKLNAELEDGVIMGEAILCLAYNHMATIMGEDAAGDQLSDVDVGVQNLSKMRGLLAGQLLCGSSQPDEPSPAQIAALKEQYSWKNDFDDPHGCRQLRLLDYVSLQKSFSKISGEVGSSTSSDEVQKEVVALDGNFAPKFGGMGSLRGLCQAEYDDSRRRIICTFVKSCGLVNLTEDGITPSQAELIWNTSLKIMEDGLRDAMLNLTGSETKKESCASRCKLYNQVSTFLSSLDYFECISVNDAAREIAMVYKAVKSESDLELLQKEMNACSRRSLLRLISVQDVVDVISSVSMAGHGVDSFIALEALVNGLPRLLGRSPADALSRIRKQGLARPEANRGISPVHSNSAGAGRLARAACRNYVHKIFALIGQIASSALLQRERISTGETVVSVNSLLLSLVTVFTIILKDENVDEIVRSSGVIKILKVLLEEHRTSITPGSVVQNDDQLSMVMKLQGICEREVSRSVLRACVAATHTLVFQASSRIQVKAPNEAASDAAFACFDIVFREMQSAVALAEKMVVEDEGAAISKRADADWEKFCESVFPPVIVASGEKKRDSRQVRSAGLMYLQERGTTHIFGLVGSSQKSSSRQKNSTATSRVPVDNPINLSGFAFQLVSQWLHILCGVLYSPIARSLLGSDLKWISLLLSAAGIDVSENQHGAIDSVSIRKHSDGLLPARFRSRILRFLVPLLEAVEPNDRVVEGLFCLASMGSPTMPPSLDEDEKFVAREAITLLRQLHSPARAVWRNSVNRVVAGAAVPSPDDNKNMLRLGVLSFLAGNIEVTGRGSYVLLKPAAAVPLSMDQQSLPSGKGHASGLGGSGSGVGVTPHHTVGNGTEGVVAGLCRHDASAGLVSNIDLKNGICEVVLLTRDPVSSDENGETLLLSKPSGTSGSRHTLTVRALRTALSDVVHAQEAPLYLDEAMALENLLDSLMEPALSCLFAVMKPSSILGELGEVGAPKATVGSVAGLSSGLMNISASLMLLRSAIVVLSDQGVASTFIHRKESKGILSRILSLAWPADCEREVVSDFVSKAQGSFLSSLPFHEARYGHLVSILRDLSLRADALSEMNSEELAERLEGLQARQAALRQAENKGILVATSAESLLSASSAAVDSESGSEQLQTVGTTAGAATNNDSEAGSRGADVSNRAVSQSTISSQSEDEEENEAAATAAAHLREAAIAQMAELGLPRSWSELALRRTGGNDIEAAVHFCLERGGEMERLLAEERERERLMQRQAGGGQSSRRRGFRSESGSSNHLLRQLLEMGFPSRWCAEALAATGNNVDEALTWILTHGERLSEEDEAMEDEDNGEDIDDEDESVEDEEDDDEDGAGSVSGADAAVETAPKRSTEESDVVLAETGSLEPVWSGSVVPLRFISGRSIIDPKTLAISGLPTGGFSSVGTKGILLCSGKWYYEAILETAGCLQIGWADGSFAGHCHADRGDGTGDGPSSWAFDGWRRYRWHSTATEWGCRWKEGDVVGCLVDMDARTVSFTLNGRGEDVGMGVAFSGEGFRPCGGVYACVSFNRREKLRLRLCEPFRYQPPSGYKGVGVAVLEAVKERETLALKEQILDVKTVTDRPEASKRFLCDFSDGEHGHELMAWAHRYYGSDASVHLGSGRSKQLSATQKVPSIPLADANAAAFTTRRVEKVWSSLKIKEGGNKTAGEFNEEELVSMLKKGFTEAAKQLDGQLVNESAVLAILFARKLILHLIVTMSEDFDLNCFVMQGADSQSCARQFWRTVESCASLRCAGWVGEAGAMAIAAEALGLGISSNDHGHSRQSASERAGIASASDLDDGALVPAGGITQFLSAVMRSEDESTAKETGSFLAACAEAAIGSDGGGGVLVFLQKGLQSAVQKSPELRQVLTAAVRRSIRLLAVVEYEGDDSDGSDQNEDDADADRSPSSQEKKHSANKDEEQYVQEISALPDARLTSFLTGLLMSNPVEQSVSHQDFAEVVEDLFQAWSIGMLSASLPWRMVCAFTVAGILNKSPGALGPAVAALPTLARFYGRLESTVARRVWAERAAVPVCSRYVQAMIELLSAVKRSVPAHEMPPEFMKFWGKIAVDAATPLPLSILGPPENESPDSFWESDDGWVSCDTSWEVWTGSVEYMSVDWETPSRSPVRSLMDGGEGPPMLREGCFVMRGLDWLNDGSGASDSDDDGKALYDAEKAKREKEKRQAEDESKSGGGEGEGGAPQEDNSEENDDVPSADPTAESPTHDPAPEASNSDHGAQEATDKIKQLEAASSKKQKKKKIPSPKLPVGTVVSIEPWKGMPGLGRKVRWHLTGKEGVYRYGGDGGRYDISHVELNEKCTRVKKRHPLPESSEQCAARHGFGASKKYSVILRLQRGIKVGSEEGHRVGVLEWPDFGAGVLVHCVLHSDGAISVAEKQLVYGSKDAGWEARFGQPSFVPGSCFVLSPTDASGVAASDVNSKSPYLSFYEELLGSTSFKATSLRNRADGGNVAVTCEMRLLRSRQGLRTISTSTIGPVDAPIPPPIHFDREYHASSLSLSRDGRTVSCIASDGRGAAYASVGFTKGVHYWEVKLEQADIGSVFIGVAEKPNSSGSGGSYDTPPRLNRWPGWGFVNFRATYSSGAERVYGAHCHAGDTVGVLLDCDAGRVSFFFDGLKYGEHILNDLGCAFENLSPFGFNVDGCGSGGAGQGAPSGIEGGRGGRYPAQGSVRPRALWPVIGLRNQGDRVTISPKWTTSYGVDGVTSTRNALAVDELLFRYSAPLSINKVLAPSILPEWFIKEAFKEYQRWYSDKWKRSVTRGSGPYRQTSYGLDVDLDASPLACATACAALGLKRALLAGDRVRLLRSAGRLLELAEEAVILGVYQGRLFYQIVSQKSEGGSLTEGGGRAWFLDESEVVDGLPYIGKGRAEDIELPLMDRFKCTSPGGLKISYEGGAVIRSDLEIIDGSLNLGVIPVNVVIERKDVLEKRVNSCGVTRYRVRAKLGEETKEGWISARIRGGKEEAIVEAAPLPSADESEPDVTSYPTALDCALAWKKVFDKKVSEPSYKSDSVLNVNDIEVFKTRLEHGVFSGLSIVESDSLLVSAVSAISNFSDSGDAVDGSFEEILSAVKFALDAKKGVRSDSVGACTAANQAAAYAFNSVTAPMPTIEAIMARIALVRAFNRRARLALPWLSVRPSQEGSAILGGLCGHGASTERSGRNRLLESQQLWIQIPSIATRIRSLRKLFFSSVKKGLLQSITEATATPTPLSHDEYELPREIRTVRINRLRSRIAIAGTDNRAKRKYSVFAQLLNETKGWGGAALRRGYVAKGHGGQRRAFKVKLIGEGVNDYSGPYREAFTDAFAEVLNTDPATGRGSLGVLDPTPNKSADLGENRDLFMFSLNGRDLTDMQHLVGRNTSTEEKRIWQSFSSLTAPRDELSREVEESLVFLGRLTGTAFRHGIPVDLPLPLQSVWYPIVEEEAKEDDRLRELDELAYRQRTKSNCSPLLWWQQRMLNSFVEGLSNVLPVEVLTLLDGVELRDLICGKADVDVDLLRSVVEYEGYVEQDKAIQFFWETLRELSNDERKLFLQFVWARNRLPLKKSDFEAPFKIQRDVANASHADQALPSASTCFFSLALPEYSSKEVLKKKLLFAISNVTTMETDFQTNSAEIAEGYRAF